jgi:cell division septation protein DedD
MFSEKYDLLFKQPIIVHISEFSGKTVYKMIIGNFVTSAEAQHLLVQMRAKGVNGFVKDLREIKA